MTTTTTEAAGTTYLELSEEGGGAHKFYEVVVDGVNVTITYGRIGEKGQAKTTAYADEAKALAAARKKVGEKLRKGYEHAVRGVRQRRVVTRRVIQSQRSTAKSAPVLWKYDSGSPAFGIFADADRVMVGNEKGDIWTLSPDGGEVLNRLRLPDGVKCLVGDDQWIYAGCDDGNVYDIGGKAPRVAYEIADHIDIYWLDIHDGMLGVSDAGGGITTIDHEDESLWADAGRGSGAWMVRCDEKAVYHGHSAGVEAFAKDGSKLWYERTQGAVLFGWQEKEDVYAATANRKVHRIAKADGRTLATYNCDASVFSCATAEGGRYIFAGDSHSSVYCFAEDGRRLWKLGTGCGSAYSMQYFGNRLYIVTTTGALACVDVSESAIAAAEQGTVPQVRDIKLATLEAVVPAAGVETTTDAAGGVVLECVDAGGGRLRVRVVSEGHERSWNVQFPKALREAGARYVVDAVRPSAQGGFYRVSGEIRRLV